MTFIVVEDEMCIETGKENLARLNEGLQNYFRNELRLIRAFLDHENEMRVLVGSMKLSPADYLKGLQFTEPEIGELLTKAEYTI